MSPSRLGPYRIVRGVGRGGMGTVYLGIDDSTGQTAAVKLLAADMAQQSDFRDRFKAEIETLRKLNHPNIVQIFGFGEDEEQIFYAMEFVAGSSLEEQIGRGRSFAWREVAQFGIAMAKALRHAHDRGVIHRDIKPGNLLLTEDGILKLSDFGIARLFGNMRLTGVGSVLGTAEFMAPEQAEGRPVDPRSDLYSLGGVLYVLLARRPLFIARSFVEMLEKQRSEKPAALGQFAADIPAELEQIIHRLLEKDPSRRFPTATALERRLETMLETFAEPPAQEPQAEPQPASRPATRETTMGACCPPQVPCPASADAPPVTVDPPPAASQAGLDPPPVNPLARTIAATHVGGHPALPIVPPADQAGLPAAGIAAAQDSLPAALPEPAPDSPRPASRFVPVRPGELDEAAPVWPAGAWISPQTAALAVGLLAVSLLAFYLLRPPSADALYRRIQRQTEGQSADALPQAEDDIRQFIERFPGDPRIEGVKEYEDKIEMSRLERRLELHAKGLNVQGSLSPVERSYVDALNTARIDPETGMAKFQAMIDLFDSPEEVSGPRRRRIQLAKQRLGEAHRQDDAQSREQLPLVEERMHQADELRKTDPQRARAMYRAVIVLYRSKAWAQGVVQRARTALEKGE